MKLAENLKRLRMQKQLSQPELADRAEVSKGYIYMLESGEMANPSLEKLLQISKALECTIADLVGHPKAAVKTDAAVEIPEVVTLVGFAPQSRDTAPIREDQSILLIHSEDDENVPITASEEILADTPPQSRREFHRLVGFDHHLDGTLPEVAPIVDRWLSRELPQDPSCRN